MMPLANCLSDPINYVIDKDGDFYCPKCDNGFTWKDKVCKECDKAIDGCLTCDFHGTCRKCKQGTFLSLDKSICIPDFINCGVKDVPTSSKDYIVRSTLDGSVTEFGCPSCEVGFYWNEVMWDCVAPCSDWDLYATDCDELQILSCTSDYMVSPDKIYCQPIINNCKDADSDKQPLGLIYGDEWDQWICDECEPGFIGMEKDGVYDCYECTEGCNKCNKLGKCESCLDTHNFLEGICLPKIKNCAIEESV